MFLTYLQYALTFLTALPTLIKDIQGLIAQLHPVAQPVAQAAVKDALASGSFAQLAQVHQELKTKTGCAAPPAIA